MHLRHALPLLVLAVMACTKNEAPRNDAPAAPPPQVIPPPPPPPAAAPGAAMTSPDDIAHAQFAPTCGVDIASMTRLPNGVYIKELRAGTGPAAKSGSTVALHYVGVLPTGAQFDSNVGTTPPLTFMVDAGQVVPGFDWAVKGMKAGGQRKVIIPPSLGYGSHANGPLPPNAILVFTIDLVSTRG